MYKIHVLDDFFFTETAAMITEVMSFPFSQQPLLRRQISSTQLCSLLIRQRQPLEMFCKKRGSQRFRTWPQTCNFITKETLAKVFSCEFCEISWNIMFTEHFRATASDPDYP